MATRATTAWGETTVVEEVALPQEAGEKEFATVVQLLVDDGGRRYVRFAYTTDGTARRGPVTLRSEDLARLRDGLSACPGLAAALGVPAAAKGGGRRGRSS